jgi:hypothetical protein
MTLSHDHTANLLGGANILLVAKRAYEKYACSVALDEVKFQVAAVDHHPRELKKLI